MKTTVIIPTYDRVGTLGRAIASLLRHRHLADLDILVADDGSEDATPALMAALCSRHPEVRYVRQAHAGVARARNLGLAHLLPETAFVTFLDSDDVAPVGRFSEDLPLLLADDSLDLTYGRMTLVDSLAEETWTPMATSRQVTVVGISLTTGIYRRRLIDRIGRFDETLRQAEDIDYLLRMFESGSRFSQTETVYIYYVRHPGNMTRDTAEASRSFAAAMLRSIQRRRADPTLVLRKPSFDLTSIQQDGLF